MALDKLSHARLAWLRERGKVLRRAERRGNDAPRVLGHALDLLARRCAATLARARGDAH